MTMSQKLKASEAAQLIKRSEPTMERWRRLRKGPPFFRICGRVLYDAADLEKWIEEQKQATEVRS